MMAAGSRRRPSRPRSARALLALPVLALVLAGCGSGPRIASAPVPPDPPPVPGRKPTPPLAMPSPMPETPVVAVARIEPVPQVRLPSVRPRQPVAPPTRPRPAGAKAAAAKAAAAPRSDATALYAYNVQAGDTVYGVSRRLGVPLRTVIDANHLAPPFVLNVGQTLRIPNPRRHEVAVGETVYGVSRRYGVDVSELVRLNEIAPPFLLAAGQNLLLPVATDARSTLPRQIATTSAPPQEVASPVMPAAAQPRPARLAAIPQPAPRSASTFLLPVSGRVIDGYGPKKNGLRNDGINIAAPDGAPIRAAENGVVIYTGNELRGFGNLILVKHDGGWVTAYAHTRETLVGRGTRVQRGQVIARVGKSGNVSRPQLHFEIRRGTRAVDPRRLLDKGRA